MVRTAIAITVLMLSGTSALAQGGDAALGETVFKKCMSCHAAGEGATNKVGPVLTGVVGRTAGTYEGYSYSQAMKDAGAGGLVWTPENLALAKPEDAMNVIAYLQSLSPPPAQ